jgi:hypothetical protein
MSALPPLRQEDQLSKLVASSKISFHTPATLEIVGNAYDDAWSEIARRFDGTLKRRGFD